MSLFQELKRRNVFRVGVAYAVVAWLILQLTDVVGEILELPAWGARLILLMLVVGFVIALLAAWAFELTPEGIKRESDVRGDASIVRNSGRTLDRAIIVLLIVALGYFVWEARFMRPAVDSPPADSGSPAETAASEPARSAEAAPGVENTASTHRESVAVLPFRAMSDGTEDEHFADGLTEEILNALTTLPELLVTARTSSFYFKGKDLPVPEIAATLGVDHVVEGSVRRAGETVRVTAQLIRAEDGFHLWSDTYDRTLDNLFTVQEDIAASIAEALDVVLDNSRRAVMRQVGVGDVEAFIAFQQGMEIWDRAHISATYENLREANVRFDEALEIAPGIVNALLFRSDYFGHIIVDHANGTSPRSEAEVEQALFQHRATLDRAAQAATNRAQRAILEAERDYFSGDWRRMSENLDQAFVAGYCNQINYLQTLATTFGWADGVRSIQHEQSLCDPLQAAPYRWQAQAHIWLSQAEQGRTVIEQFLERFPRESWVDEYLVLLQMTTGKRPLDSSAAASIPALNGPMAVIVHAYNGDLGTAKQVWAEVLAKGEANESMEMCVESILGNRDRANELAARMDQRTAGQVALVSGINVCYRGAPFDLEAAPTFSQLIAEAGFRWPPPTPIAFPARKDQGR